MAYRSHTTAGDAASTTLGITTPGSSVTDDIFVMHVYIEATLGLTVTFDKGTWTKDAGASGQQLGDATDFEVYRFTARQDGTISGTITISWGGASLWNSAICACHSGRITSGLPQDATSTFNIAGVAGTTATALGVTTGHTNADLLMFESEPAGSLHSTWSSPLTERADFGGQGYAEGSQAAAAPTGDKTVTVASSWWSAALIVLREVAASTDTQEWLPRWAPHRPIRDTNTLY